MWARALLLTFADYDHTPAVLKYIFNFMHVNGSFRAYGTTHLHKAIAQLLAESVPMQLFILPENSISVIISAC